MKNAFIQLYVLTCFPDHVSLLGPNLCSQKFLNLIREKNDAHASSFFLICYFIRLFCSKTESYINVKTWIHVDDFESICMGSFSSVFGFPYRKNTM